MPIDGLTGIASGVDTSAIVDQLMAIDRQQTARLGFRQDSVKARQAGITEVASQLSALKLAAQNLASASTWVATQTVDSSDPAKVTATRIGGAGIGGHTIAVDRLASSAQRGFGWTPSPTAGSFDIYYGTDPAATGASKITVNVGANATAADVAAAINGNGSAPAYATVLTDPASGAQRLVLSARKPGEASSFSVNQAGMSGQMTEDPAYERSGPNLDSAYRVDGSSTVLHSPSNVVENAIPGVRLAFKGVTTTDPVTVNVSPPQVSPDAVNTKVAAFVDAYNTLVNSIRAKVSEKPIPNAATAEDAGKGQLFGDTGLTSMLTSLRSRMSTRDSTLTGMDELSDIGVGEPKSDGTVNEDAKAGLLALDPAKLLEAMGTDSSKVRDLFSSFSTGLTNYVRTQTGGGHGMLDGRQTASNTEIAQLQDQILRQNDRMDMTQKRLKAQFAAMETALLHSQTQSSWLTGQINSLG
jgi:flagellar hook-associated protein 2